MQQAMALDMARLGVQTAFMVLLPILAVALFVGILVSVFQALTQIQEATLVFVPKVLAVVLVMMLLGNWMVVQVVGFTQLSFQRIAYAGGGR